MSRVNIMKIKVVNNVSVILKITELRFIIGKFTVLFMTKLKDSYL